MKYRVIHKTATFPREYTIEKVVDTDPFGHDTFDEAYRELVKNAEEECIVCSGIYKQACENLRQASEYKEEK